MLKSSSLAKWGVAVLLVSSLSSCEDILEQYFPKPTPPPVIPTFPNLGLDIPFYALSGGTKLDAYSTKDPSTRTSSVSITGLGNGETLLAIDFRPATGQLYGVSSGSRLYVINQNTGVARAIGSAAFTPAVAGNLVGFDFNPTVDRIRLVTSTGQNLRLNPETGTVANTDGAITGAAGATITGAAYTNNVAGAETTVLYDLDPATDQLYRQDPPNNGTLVAVGALNLNVSGDGGFDIDARTGTALGLYTVNGNPTLFTLDLATGAARPLAQYAANAGYTGIAIPTRPVAYAVNALSNSTLLIFDLTNPSTLVSKPITGLASDAFIKGLDFRPANGQLYALSSDNGLYTINASSGAATLIAPLSIPVIGASVGFDFNPVADRIRIVTSSDQNLRVNPVDGSVVQDTPLNPSERIIFGSAYSNNYAGATTTTLYNLGRVLIGRQTTASTLYQQTPPNDGNLVEIARLAPDNIGSGSFDIGGTSNIGYALVSLLFNPVNTLYSVDLQTGKLTAIGSLPQSSSLGFTVGLGF
ncbi:conserved hypothetical protein [Hymenobacter roseosalivarius DSM 11622]|uniref:DUF4394 domain-containing protein n=1 Tax=Hymenobacter roseosalivarius DSM 11622 TaxID=645990 RepID=A0A1W1W505_9BACT|nr:DUF4394 domain-containing protein [Hymenobacter roseosalivarius]SMC00712.1 conserved hypothetical protein [Hymenobacter roseosalivarius DSM 11622]